MRKDLPSMIDFKEKDFLGQVIAWLFFESDAV